MLRLNAHADVSSEADQVLFFGVRLALYFPSYIREVKAMVRQQSMKNYPACKEFRCLNI